nr:comE operon protein 3-like [Nerophis lumbriciformis]
METNSRFWRAAPALPYATATLFGVIGGTILRTPLLCSATLIALGLALASPMGRGLALLAIGLVVGTLDSNQRDRAWQGFEPARPVEMLVRAVSHAERGPEGEVRLWVEAEQWRQRRRIGLGKRRLRLTLPAEVEPPIRGETLRVRGYLRRSTGFWNGTPQPPPVQRLWVKSPRLVGRERSPGLISKATAALRQRSATAWDGFSGPGVVLARALLLGDRSQLSEDWQRGLRAAGLQHLLAVSGLHVGLVALGLARLAGRWRRTPRYLLAAGGVLSYLLLVGPRPSVLRAAAMGLLVLAAKLAQRPPAVLNTLALVAAALVVLEPPLAADLGFRLSVLATAGILSLGQVLARRWQALPEPLAGGLAASTAAQVFTWPLTVPLSGGIAAAGWLLNLLAVPWLAVFLLTAVAWWLLAAAGWPGANLAAQALDLLSQPLDGLARLPPGWLGRLTLPPSSVLASLLSVSTMVALLAPLRWRRALLLTSQGDALLIRDGPRAVLVDGGGWRYGDLGGRALVPALAAAGIGRLDAVVLTHPDSDHCHGLRDLASYLPVAEVWMSPGWTSSPCASGLATLPASRWRPLWRGDRLQIGRWRLDVLHPPAGERGGEANDRSLVLLAEVHGRRLLLTGDIEAAAEVRLRRYWRRQRHGPFTVDLLKVAHHGSKSSTSRPFLAAIAPGLAMISAGRGNRYGHPASVVVDRLSAEGTKQWSTSRSGALTVQIMAGGRLRLRPP